MAITKMQLTAISVVAILLAVCGAYLMYGNGSDNGNDNSDINVGDDDRMNVIYTFKSVDDSLECTIDGKRYVTGDVITIVDDVEMTIKVPSTGTVTIQAVCDNHGGMGPGDQYFCEFGSGEITTYLLGDSWFADTTGDVTITFSHGS